MYLGCVCVCVLGDGDRCDRCADVPVIFGYTRRVVVVGGVLEEEMGGVFDKYGPDCICKQGERLICDRGLAV